MYSLLKVLFLARFLRILDYYQKLLHVELGYHITGSIHLPLELLLAMECIVFYPHAVFLLAG